MHSTVEELNATELYTVKRLILHYVNSLSIKHNKKITSRKQFHCKFTWEFKALLRGIKKNDPEVL